MSILLDLLLCRVIQMWLGGFYCNVHTVQKLGPHPTCSSSSSSSSSSFSTSPFQTPLTHHLFMLLSLQVLEWGYNVFWMDSDTVLMRNPWDVLPLNHSWEGACSVRKRGSHDAETRDPLPDGLPASEVPYTWRRNVGLAFWRSERGTREAQVELLEQMLRPNLAEAGQDESLYQGIARGLRLSTYCVPPVMDGLACNHLFWEQALYEVPCCLLTLTLRLVTPASLATWPPLSPRAHATTAVATGARLGPGPSVRIQDSFCSPEGQAVGG